MSGANSQRRRHSGKSWLLFALLLFLSVALIVPPLVNVNRYKHRITDIVSRSLGRPVRISDVKLHLLPRPGFEISDLVVSEDPSFGAEPVLRSPSVTAAIRLTSLWRGRLEIARISLDEPSMNLVRNGQGRWNLAAVILQASRLSNAPTGQRHAGSALRFPYIEASNARINFKSGVEKKPFSFVNTDFSVWLENPNEWRLRMVGQPVRTDLDLDLSDTGIVRVEGSLHRAATLGDMPIDIEAEWSDVQVGQMARMLMGVDTGWRGAVRVRANLSGTADQTQLKARVRVANVHRVEFAPLQAVNLDTNCKATYQKTTASLDGLACLSSVGDGQVLVTGNVQALDHPIPNLALDFQRVPASVLLDMLRVVRHGFAPSAQAGGTLDGHLTWVGNPVPALSSFSGQGTITALSLSAPGFDKPLTVPVFHFASLPQPAPVSRRHGKATPAPAAPPPGLILDPVSLAMGSPEPLIVRGNLSPAGFDLHLGGSAAVSSLSSLSQNFGLLGPQLASLGQHGQADLDLSVHGAWLAPLTDTGQPATSVTTQGLVRLRNATVNTSLLSKPIEIVTAQASFGGGQVSWNAVSANYGTVHLEGSFNYPLACPTSSTCPRRFDLHTPQLDAAEIQAALIGDHGELMEAILSRLDHHAPWPLLTGTVHAGTFSIGTLAIHDATAALTIDKNRVELRSLEGHALGGGVEASGSLDSTGDTPRYAFQAECNRADPSALAKIFHEKWGAGSVNLSMALQVAGVTPTQLADSAKGTFSWDWTHGSLPGDVDSASPLARFDQWHAEGSIASRSLKLERGTLHSGNAVVPLQGTISFAREVSLKTGGEGTPVTITGTLEHTHLATEPAEPNRAALKNP